jgi:hypothetical protein
MSQSQARLFEKWLEAGDDRTFGEWLVYRRQCVTQERQQRDCAARLFAFSHQLQQAPSTPFYQAMAAAQAQQYAPRGLSGGLLGNVLGGMFRPAVHR